MLRDVRIGKESFWTGVNVYLAYGGKPIINLPAYITESSFRASAKKNGGQVAFENRQSFPIPAFMPGRLIQGDKVTSIRRYQKDGSVSRLDVRAGIGGEPLIMMMGQGLLGDSQTLINVGRNIILETAVKEGSVLHVDLAKDKCFRAKVTVIR